MKDEALKFIINIAVYFVVFWCVISLFSGIDMNNNPMIQTLALVTATIELLVTKLKGE